MTKEEILAALRNLQNHATSNTSEQQREVDNETAELDSTIEEYNEKIAELESKLENVDNYQYEEPNKEERELTEELLEESFANQIEVLDREDAEYKHLQDLATSIFTDYNEEIAQLNVDIAAIERRLRKNDIAVRKNIGIRLTDEELADLNSTLEAKRARVAECEKYKIQYTEELSNYGELITANNRKREIVTKKQERLAAIKAERANNPKTVDNYKLQKDKDELASLKAGLVALQSRKDYINYDMKSEIDKLIKETENLDFAINDNQTTNEVGTAVNDEEENEFANTGFKVTPLDFNDDEPTVEETEKQEKEVPGIPEVTSAHDLWLQQNSPLDEEREAEIEEAKEELKKKKKDGFFKKHWKKFVAAGLILVTALAIKGCSDIKNAKPEDISNTQHSYAQEVDQEEDKIDDWVKDDGKTEVDTGNSITTPAPAAVVTPSKGQTPSTPSTTEIKNENNTNSIPTNEPTQNVQEENKEDLKTDENKKTVELNAGEKMISVTDLFNDNINDNTVISHGEAVGTATDSAELKDYTEDGKAAVEYETGKQEETKKMTKEEYKALLDKLSGGTGVLTPEGEQWLDELASGKTR